MNNKREKILLEIARKVLGLETLEARKLDSLDFHEHAVWSIKEALEKAYQAGRENSHEHT